MGLQNCFALAVPQGDQALLFTVALADSDFGSGSAIWYFEVIHKP